MREGEMRDASRCAAVRQLMEAGAELAAEAREHLAGCEGCHETYMEALVARALEVKPEIAAPEGFAQRVMAELPEITAVPSPRSYGLRASLAVLMGMAAVASLAGWLDPSWLHVEDGRLALTAELVGVGEIVAIALWLGLGMGPKQPMI